VAAPNPKVYVAGPLGFTDSGRVYNTDVLIPTVRAAGFEPLDPWELPAALLEVFERPLGDPTRLVQLAATNRDVGRRNADMIRAAAGVLAVLDGSDVDSGTAAEIGYAAALGKPVVGLRSDLRITGDNEATLVNLQVEWFVVSSGGALVTDLDAAIDALTRLLL
jgi:nucleoside 2-deoxyribosyltransferase